MKRVFLILSMIACLCLSGVSFPVYATSTSATEITEDMYKEYAEGLLQQITAMDDATIESYISGGSLPGGLAAGLTSWQSMREDLGAFVEIISSEVTVEEEAVTIVVKANFANSEGTYSVTMLPDGSDVTASGFEKVLTLGEIFKKAALNTVIGMGTVFVVLIFISFIISLFKYIPAIQAKFAKKTAVTVEEPVQTEVLDTVEEELVDDGELAAVITAAIYAAMASEGKAISKDGLIVRSIRRSRKR